MADSTPKKPTASKRKAVAATVVPAKRKAESIILGGRMLKFKAGCLHYSIHEDLICSKSNYFKLHMQKNRKLIEGDCAICREELISKADNITFCRDECGQNLHEHCMESWKKQKRQCPHCRKQWKDLPAAVIDLIFPFEVDSAAVKSYLRWFYSPDDLPPLPYSLGKSTEAKLIEFMQVALRLHTVADKMEDEQFRYVAEKLITSGWRKASLARLSSDDRPKFMKKTIDAVYNDKTIALRSRVFFMTQILPSMRCLNLFSPDYSLRDTYPKGFYEYLAEACSANPKAAAQLRQPITDTGS